MSANSCLDHWLYLKYFSEQSYYCYIYLFFSLRTMVLFQRFRCWLLYFVIFFVSSSQISATTRWFCLLHWKYFSESIILLLYIIICFSQHNGIISTSPLFIIVYFCFYLFPPHGLVWPLVGIAYYIESTLMSNYIIALYRHCFSPSTMAPYHCHRCWFLYFVIFLFPHPNVWVWPLVGIADYIGILCSAIILSLYCYI